MTAGLVAVPILSLRRIIAATLFAVLAILMAAPTPAAAQGDIAVIIGNTSGSSGAGEAAFAHRDAAAIKKFIASKFGYPETNIIDVRDAAKDRLEKLFGGPTPSPSDLARRLEADGAAKILVYYSGRGAFGRLDHQPYLLAVDADAANAEAEGYALAQLLDNLSRLPAAAVTVFLETGFSGSGPEASIANILPAGGAPLSVLIATRAGQTAHPDRTARLGMFTRHLLEALRGVADSADYGNHDGSISLDEIKAYLDHRLPQSTRRRFGIAQTAALLGLADAEIFTYRSDRAGSAKAATTLIEDNNFKPGGADASRSDTDICIYATKHGGAAWETVGDDFQRYVDEADRRGLTLKKCEALLIDLKKSQANPGGKSGAKRRSTSTTPKSSSTRYDGKYNIVAECSGARDWKVGATVTDGVMIIRGRTGWTIEGQFNENGEINLEGTVDTQDGESLNFWAEVSFEDGKLNGRSVFTGSYAPVSCSFNGDRL